MRTLTDEIAAYDARRAQLEADHFGDWVVFKDGEMQIADRDFQRVAAEAVRRYGRGPFLLRRVGEGPPSLPPSLLYGN